MSEKLWVLTCTPTKKKKTKWWILGILALGILVLLFLKSVSAISYCYQESSNESNQTGIDGDCDLNYSGSYYLQDNSVWSADNNLTKIIDGNWNTSVYRGGIYVNYTKPQITGSCIWNIKTEILGNINISIPNDCFNADEDKIILSSLTVSYGAWDYRQEMKCWNNTEWKLINQSLGGETGDFLYEEAIYWQISGEPELILKSPINGSFVNTSNINFSFGIKNVYNNILKRVWLLIDNLFNQSLGYDFLSNSSFNGTTFYWDITNGNMTSEIDVENILSTSAGFPSGYYMSSDKSLNLEILSTWYSEVPNCYYESQYFKSLALLIPESNKSYTCVRDISETKYYLIELNNYNGVISNFSSYFINRSFNCSDCELLNLNPLFVSNLSDGLHNYTSILYYENESNIFAYNGTLYFTIDTIKPQLTIDSVSTTQGSQTISFNSTANDTNLDTCKYSIYSNGSIDGISENVSFDCNTLKTASATKYGTFTLRVYANDTAGNENYTEKEFTLIPNTGGGTGGGFETVINYQPAENFSIVTQNYGNVLDFSLAKDSIKARTKYFYAINDGLEAVNLTFKCDTQNVNESTRNISICNYVEFPNSSVIVSPNSLDPEIIQVKVLTPENSSLGDKYYFNILATTMDGSTIEFSKLSVSTSVTFFGQVTKWSYLPSATEDKTIYPVWTLALFLAVLFFALTYWIFAKLKMETLGFFLSILVSIFIFFLTFVIF